MCLVTSGVSIPSNLTYADGQSSVAHPKKRSSAGALVRRPSFPGPPSTSWPPVPTPAALPTGGGGKEMYKYYTVTPNKMYNILEGALLALVWTIAVLLGYWMYA